MRAIAAQRALLLWRVFRAVALVVGSEVAATCFCAVPVGAVANANVVAAPLPLSTHHSDINHKVYCYLHG